MGYPINQSALFRVTTRAKLATRLQLTNADLVDACRNARYSAREIVTKSGKRRQIREPLGTLRSIHKRVAILLSRITAPDFLYCPVKGRSYVSNAHQHAGNKQFAKLDVKSYFESTPRRRICWFFHKIMECSSDVSAILASLLSVDDDCLATGSPASPILSFYAFYDVWQNVARIAKEHGLTITLYMDDLTLSGIMVPERYVWQIRKAIYRSGLRYHKERRYSNGLAEITGVILRDGQAKLPNRQHLKAHEVRERLRSELSLDETFNLERRLVGLSAQRRQVEAPR